MVLSNVARFEPEQSFPSPDVQGRAGGFFKLGDWDVSIKCRGMLLRLLFPLLFPLLFLLLFLFAASFSGQRVVAIASDKPAAAPSPSPAPAGGHASPPAKVEHAPSPTPSPISVNRFVSLPEFRVFSLQGKSAADLARAEKQSAAAKVYDYQQARFTLVVALASWSSRAAEVATKVQSWQARLSKRGVKIVGIFNHDSLEDIVAMANKQAVTFPVAKVGLDFVAKLLNPKVPTLWIVDHDGHVVYRKERPTDSDISETEQYLLDWTDF